MRLEIQSEEREILLRDLEEAVESVGEGLATPTRRAWDPHDPANPHSIAIVVRARDELRGEAPWHLEGSRGDLELLITQLRKGASLFLERRGEPMPAEWLQSPNVTDREGTDFHLDVIGVCDVMLKRLLASAGA